LVGVLGRTVVGASVPLGRLTPGRVAALVASAADLRITTARGVVLRGVADPGAAVAVLEAAGLSCDPDSPWLGVTACSGLGACRRALADVRADAARFALGRLRHDVPTGHPRTHWAGCARACGRPAGATALIAREDGGYEVAGGEPAP
jgi:precorrin-3B synthase